MVAPSAAEDVPRAACREQSDVVASEACQPTDAVAPLARSEGEAAYRAPCPAVGEAACQRADSGAVTLRSLRGKKVTRFKNQQDTIASERASLGSHQLLSSLVLVVFHHSTADR